MAQFEQHFVQDLTQPIIVRHCGTIVFNADDESNVISVRLFNGSEPVAISGSVVGAVVCSDGSTVTLAGSYSENTASITLTGDCFAILGQIGVGIQIVNGTQKTTVLKAIYNVETFTTENVVDPGSRITLEVGDLIDDIETAVASIPADYSDLLAAIAPNYSELTFPVKAGTFCWYDGTLYQAQQDIATSEAWTAAHWASSVLTTSLDEKLADVDDELGDLKSALDTVNDGYYSFDLIPNKYILRDNGTEANYNGWSASDFIPVQDNSLVILTTPTTLSWGALYDKNKQYISAHGWNSGESKNFFHDGELRYFRISGANSDMESVTIRIFPEVDTSLAKTGYPADAKAVGDRLSVIESSSGVIPSYYESQLAAKEAIIRGHFDDCAFNGDGLIFLTDTNFSVDLFTSATPTSYFNANNSFSLIADIFKKCAIDKIAFGGDLVNSAPDVDTMLLCMASFGTRFGERQSRLRYCVGNHEYFTGNDLGQTTKPTQEMLYGAGVKYNEDIVLGKGDMVTYYFDNALQKIRYFVVSCGRDTETTAVQIAWLLKEFEEIPAGYKVVVIGHGFIADNMTAFRGSYAPIAAALDAVKAKTSYVYNSVTYDYSTLSNVDVVCMITGHTHIDGSIVTTGGIPCICTTTDSYANNYELVNGTPTKVERQKGTVNEQAFDVYQFDFTNRKIYVTRIGYGSDREFSY